jgi:putative aldouronate transport system permease protein
MPHFLSWISVVGLFFSFFAKEGSFNMFMTQIVGESWEAKNILLDHHNFLPIIFWSHIWKAVGWSSIVFLAAITGIDDTLYEAATIDGCGKLKQIWYITLPSIKGTIVVVLVMSLGGLVTTSFDQVFGFQTLFTQEYTETINTLIYRQGIQGGKYSLASAFGLAQGIDNVSLIMMANFLSKKIAHMSIW